MKGRTAFFGDHQKRNFTNSYKGQDIVDSYECQHPEGIRPIDVMVEYGCNSFRYFCFG